MMDELRPALICIYLLLNYCTLLRMMHVDYHGLINAIWGDAERHRRFAIRLKLEKFVLRPFPWYFYLALQYAGISCEIIKAP